MGDAAGVKRALRLRYWRWRLTARYGFDVDLPGRPEATAILLSYMRPANLPHLVRACLRCRFIGKVVVSNANPEISIRSWVKARDDRLVLIDQPRRMPASYRFEIARREPGEFFLSIDDDVFIRQSQIRALYERLLDDPSVPHGLFTEGRGGRIEGPVDVIQRVYAFTGAHVEEFHRRLELLGMRDVFAAGHVEDLLISTCGKGKPRCHWVGRVADCPTSRTAPYALCEQSGFHEERAAFRSRLRKLESAARSGSRAP